MNETTIKQTKEIFDKIISQMQQQYEAEQKSKIVLPNNFICLRAVFGTHVYLNKRNIQTFYRADGWDFTKVILNGTSYEVNETPQEIASLLLK